MAHLDLDAFHAAQAEENGEPKTLTLGGETYTLPHKLPLAMSVAIKDRDWRTVAELFFGDAADTVLGQIDGKDLDEIYSKLYGTDEGNSEPSAD